MGWSPKHHPSAIEQRISVTSTLFGETRQSDNQATVAHDAPAKSSVVVESKTFSNPIGLAAGFDKDGTSIEGLLDLGFGFVEIGTVTPEPQPGNDKPRMFRLVEDFGIINRYGFNSSGSVAVEANLRDFRQQQEEEESDKTLGETSEIREQVSSTQQLFALIIDTLFGGETATEKGLVGINIGKNKWTTDAESDYVHNIRKLGPYADYIVINISSPNTPQLRDLQQADPLQKLVSSCLEARDQLAVLTSSSSSPDSNNTVPPLLVKLSSDLTDQELEDIIPTLLQVDGIIISNTSIKRPFSLLSKHRTEDGGLSGKPIKDVTTECIRKVYALTNGKIPIIGVGGVGNGHDAYEKLKAGASLIQIYSMMIYNGPGTVSRIRHELADIMLQNGERSLHDVIGKDHEEIFWRKQLLAKELKHEREDTVVVDQ